MLAEDLHGFFQSLQVKTWLGTANLATISPFFMLLIILFANSPYHWMI